MLVTQSHGDDRRVCRPASRQDVNLGAALPTPGDTAVDEAADFGFLFPPSDDPADYVADSALGELDQVGNLMVPEEQGTGTTPDSSLPAVLTYWGQFLDHELTARTDRETAISNIEHGLPTRSAAEIEHLLKNARTPRFDLDSVYGGLPLSACMSDQERADVATVISAMRHPGHPAKMRVGTALTDGRNGPVPDSLDPHRDLPRFAQVEQDVRDAFLRLIKHRLEPEQFETFEKTLPGRAIIGDMRNDENLIVAQFHLSILRFHNKAVDFLTANETGWIPDFHSARTLTTLHYQHLAIEGYLKSVCNPAVVDRVLKRRAREFFDFRAAHAQRNEVAGLGNAIPLEFSVAAYRFGHTMVRNTYDYNRLFGRASGGQASILPEASFDLLFTFTGGGGFMDAPRLPANWIIDWTRFLKADPNDADGRPARVARSIDTSLAPPLGAMRNEGGDIDPTKPDVIALFKHLARRNLRRGLTLRLPTGQAMHRHLHALGAVASEPIGNVAALVQHNADLCRFLEASTARLHERTPLWLYCLAEAQAAGGDKLGELGSFLVATTFIGAMLDDPESALSREFVPAVSPLRMADGEPIDTIERWMRFAAVME